MLCVLCMTHTLLTLQDDKTAWVQLTVKIPSEQSFAAYSAKKNLVAGNPDKAIKVEDTWVFERALKKDPTTRSGFVKQATACIMHHLVEAVSVPSSCFVHLPTFLHMLLLLITGLYGAFFVVIFSMRHISAVLDASMLEPSSLDT